MRWSGFRVICAMITIAFARAFSLPRTNCIPWRATRSAQAFCLLSTASTDNDPLEGNVSVLERASMGESRRPFFRINYNDVYEVKLPPNTVKFEDRYSNG